MNKISVLGAGAWGTALANIAANNDKKVMLWVREKELIDDIRGKRRNTLFLPNIELNENIVPTNDLTQAVLNAEAVLMVIPAQYLRAACRTLRPIWPENLPAVICAKGIEQGSGALLSEMLAEELPQAQIAVLSGPTFAEEAAEKLRIARELLGDAVDG
ncbi:MAG: NAD(P)-binding domain-containing protein [Alphaproteobacteria bacterium]|nr:NAD(P)-binding domain-containing protein [Alphaproteobacteria bacterium]